MYITYLYYSIVYLCICILNIFCTYVPEQIIQICMLPYRESVGGSQYRACSMTLFLVKLFRDLLPVFCVTIIYLTEEAPGAQYISSFRHILLISF